jgi:peptidoglycan hydrolase-like protein with peptidoglycan-binding domain
MKRTLTAAVALTAALGMAGLAHAQSSAGPSTSPSTLSRSTSSTTNNPPMTSQSGTQNPASTSTPGSTPGATGRYGALSPQADAQSMNPNIQQVSESQIEQAQQQLKSAGLYRGEVDGVMGPQTQTALSQFQKQQGLPETAQLDQQTMGRLTSNSGSGQNSAAPQATPQSPANTQNPAMQSSPSSLNGR